MDEVEAAVIESFGAVFDRTPVGAESQPAG
jgi:hypothetical protein